MTGMIYIDLFITFFVIGMFTIGGGYAMLSLIQNEVVTTHNWIDETTFTTNIAPNPIIKLTKLSGKAETINETAKSTEMILTKLFVRIINMPPFTEFLWNSFAELVIP